MKNKFINSNKIFLHSSFHFYPYGIWWLNLCVNLTRPFMGWKDRISRCVCECIFFFFLIIFHVFIFFFLYFYFNCRLITLQYCGGFGHTFTWISHGCTCVPHPEPPSHIPPHPISQGIPALSTLSHASNLDWWSISFFF